VLWGLAVLARPYWVDGWVAGFRLPCPEDVGFIGSNFDYVVSLVKPHELLECWPGGFTEYMGRLRARVRGVISFPVGDGLAPSVEEACSLIDEVIGLTRRGWRVLFHCYAGLGRTGTMLTAYLMRRYKLPLWEALERLRRANPAAGPESYEQQLFLEDFEAACVPAG
jgi:hypothetical protein